ncbi:MAG TPA: hypothetical protein VE954_37090 [Oligoflexus sp.]|uniref:hypothetical protein n=1 Tax=Oligoflexus sp. TaxID=1971216 RepID=UPI002D57C9C4|nr:hypothetical protein [Oligoflexus sp.]HYX38755.1 hypothetical protein [Oligoflexus sp.]
MLKFRGAHIRPKTWVLGAFILGLTACSKDLLEVQYPQMISPAEAYTELTKLAVGIDGKMDPVLREEVMKGLKACPLFAEVAAMDKPVRVSGSNPKDYFDALIKRSQQAQLSQGIMSIQIEDNSESSQLEKSQAFVLADQAANDWYPSFGVPTVGSLGFPKRPEVAPKWTLRKRDTYVRAEKMQYIVRFVMYNRVAGKIVHDRIVSNTSTLLNYSRKPTLKKPKFTELVQRSVMDEIMFYACPAKDQVTRKLYYVKNPTPDGEQINEGVDLAEDNRWSLAATKWTNVLLKDKKNIIAHHNLGVHYERSGEIFQAMDHFKQARLGKAGKLMDNVIEEIRNQYQPRVDGAAVYPQVTFVTGGNWAFVRSDDMEMVDGQTYSLYRFEPVVNSETSRTTGLSIREVGLFKVASPSTQYYPGRIKEFLIDYPVKPGDFVIVE